MSRYAALEGSRDGFRTVHLTDAETKVEAEIVPAFGCNTISLTRNVLNFLWMPQRTLPELREQRALFGIPLLAPWANRLDKPSYWVDGTRYDLDPSLGNLRFDHFQQPIHGLLLFEEWRVEDMSASETGAELVSVFSFTRHPKLMAQFPFAHHLELRHTLAEGRLRVSLKVINECDELIPVSIGFHPYFTIPHSDRNEWDLRLPVKQHVILSEKNIPTGEMRPVGESLIEVRKAELDDVYTDLLRDQDGIVRFVLRSRHARLTVGFGPKYPVAVVYAPHTGNFVCIEPMAAITNALNLAHDGKYDGLQSVAPGGEWHEEFSVEPALLN